MGKVLVTAKIENLEDLFSVYKELLKPEEVRTVEVTDALVDTGVSALLLPKWVIARLGLDFFGTRRTQTKIGPITRSVYGVVQLTIQGRVWKGDVIEVPDDYPIRIGKIPLAYLDFVVDPKNQCLIGNPAHDGEQMLELY